MSKSNRYRETNQPSTTFEKPLKKYTICEKLLSVVSPIFLKQNTTTQDAIMWNERLKAVVQYLVAGDAQCIIATHVAGEIHLV